MAAYWGKIICFPCNLLGKAFDGCSQLLSKGCSCCSATCEDFCCPTQRPSPIFLSYTILLAGVPGFASLVTALIHLQSDCDQPLKIFLFVQAIIAAVWVTFAAHLYRQFTKPYTHYDSQDNGPCARIWRLCMYDPFIFVILPVLVFHWVWAAMGARWAAKANLCDDSLVDMSGSSSTLSFIYLGLGFLVVALSLCCECCCRSQPPPALATHQPQHQHPAVGGVGGGIVGGGVQTAMAVGAGNMAVRMFYPQMYRGSGQGVVVPPPGAIPVSMNPQPVAYPPNTATSLYPPPFVSGFPAVSQGQYQAVPVSGVYNPAQPPVPSAPPSIPPSAQGAGYTPPSALPAYQPKYS